ncbi:hypothetical protein HDV01_005772 [Terramyces sp. JEL0728]|nr:hypothetical protein HDV01_005772 [Terramyces sp. JEL0728]
MDALTVGYYYDGTPLTYLSMDSPLDIFAMFVVVVYLVANIGMMGFIARGWLEMQVSKVYKFIWYLNILTCMYYVLLILRHSKYSFPLLCWLFSVVGVIGFYSIMMGEMEILKAFTVDSKFLSVRGIEYLQIGFTVFHFATIGGLYGIVGYIGHTPPAFLTSWNSVGYKIFVITCLVYESFHSVYVSLSIRKQVENRKNLLGGKISTRDKELNILFYLITVGLTVTWIGAVLWLLSSTKGPSSMALETIGNALGYGESLFLTGVYKYIRAVNKKSSATHSTKKSTEEVSSPK